MKILCAYFSRTGYTEKLMKRIGSNLEKRGNSIEWEEIKTAEQSSRFGELRKDLHHYPGVFIGLFKSAWRNHFTETYTQTEEDILPLRHPEVSQFDRIIIGGPKWARISYPVARYIHTLKGLTGKKVASVCTFGGPPLRVFEIELIEKSMSRILNEAGASVISHLGLSSGYHELGLMPLFRIISRIRFSRPVEDFIIGSAYSEPLIESFCDILGKVQPKSIMDNSSYLESTRLLNFDHPTIKTLVAENRWKELPEFQRIGAVYKFVRNSILFGYNSSDELTASEILAEGYGQCNTKGTLLMSLLRSCGIPCRFHAFTIDKSVQQGIITGMAYLMTPQNIIHSWVEVWFKESWIVLEGVIIDNAFFESLQSHFGHEKGLNAYGVSTPDLTNPVVEWKGENTFIQNMGINHDFGIYDSPDDFYSRQGSNLTGFKKWLYSHVVRHRMNRKVMKIREYRL